MISANIPSSGLNSITEDNARRRLTITDLCKQEWVSPGEKFTSLGRVQPSEENSIEPCVLEDLNGSEEKHDCCNGDCRRIRINVSGQYFETQMRTLSRYPNTLLGNPSKLLPYYDPIRNEYFLDRHRPSFQAILYYYQSGGRLKRPIEVQEDIFLDELEFYEFDEETIIKYKISEHIILEREKPLPKNERMRQLWIFCEDPDSTHGSKIFALTTVLCICISVTVLCVETIPMYATTHCINLLFHGNEDAHPKTSDAVFLSLDAFCTLWFVLEYILRIISCPSKKEFIFNIMNIFDLLAIVPFFIYLGLMLVDRCEEHAVDHSAFQDAIIFVRVLRVFRLFKLGKHSQALHVLGLTIKSSLRQLSLFLFFLIIAVIIFSSAVFYAEENYPRRQIKSIPGGFWWAIVTMTTVGYGDVVPTGIFGKMVGALCVITGVLTIALPVPVVVTNFNNFYRRRKTFSFGGV